MQVKEVKIEKMILFSTILISLLQPLSILRKIKAIPFAQDGFFWLMLGTRF
jgi:hypothetical protein